MSDRPTLIVMLKEPRAGRVKTRLGRDIGMVAAAWWFRHQVAGLLRTLRDPRWQLVLAVTPDRQALTRSIWPIWPKRIPQGRGDLGQRMACAMRTVPHRPVCVIGADIPDISKAHISRAFRGLGRSDAVFGPAHDGGYWLVGLRHGGMAHPRMFDGVRWSSPHALDDSIAALKGWRVGLVDRLRDVDVAADLRAAPPPLRASSR